MKRYVLGIDQGTTGVAAILFDEQWQPAARGYCQIQQFYPSPGCVEHDAEDIFDAVCAATRQALAKAAATPQDITCIGLDHEGESVVIWDKQTGKPLYHTLVWQDTRTADKAAALSQTHGAMIRERTGLFPDTYFSALKLQWLLENVPQACELIAEGRLLAGNMDAWLAWKLTSGRCHVTDLSTASRTMLLNLETETWDRDILQLLDIPVAILPTICDSADQFGETDPNAFCGICAPLCGIMNDQQAALLGQACLKPGDMKVTYGTGCFLLMNTGEHPILSDKGLITTVGWRIHGQTSYALDGGIYIAGAATQWLCDGLGIISSAAESEVLATRVPDNGGVYFVPAFCGLAAPYWDAHARGTIIGITGGTTREHIVRATLESVAYQVCDLVHLMQREMPHPIRSLRCDGGATDNAFLMQFQADILGIPVEIPQNTDATALGAALTSAIGNGLVTEADALPTFEGTMRRYEPHMSSDEREALLANWHRAVERSRDWTV